MSNECLNPNGEFMTRVVLDDSKEIDEFVKDDNDTLKSMMVTDMVKIKGIKKIGLVGKGQFINLDTDTKTFDIMGKIVSIVLLKDGKDILTFKERADRLITFMTNEQQLVRGRILNDLPVRYTFGYKVDNEYIFAKIKIALDKHRGVLSLNDMTSKDDMTAEFMVYLDNKLLASKIINFEKNKTYSMDMNLL